ncbi:MAG: hypothetical protein JWO58_52 [Chitinophagaceae bacterium]|nr:hypothetical protein [Chitinophagaceae bacterium]
MKWIFDQRYPLIVICCLSLLTIGALSLVIRYNPESMIEGQWKETAWSYEKIDTRDFVYHDIKLLRKHTAESWKFMTNHQLYFYNGHDIIAKAKWKMKGRGHILQLLYEDGTTETYDIKELNKDELVLNFDIGMESRGIARLVFNKVDRP